MNTFRRILTTAFALFLLAAAPLGARANGEEALSFGEDGTFTIMIVSDAQDLPRVSSYYKSALHGVISDYEPDFAVFLGDQLDGKNLLYRFGDRVENVKSGISGVLSPVIEGQIPFAVVLGPADADTGVSLDEQLRFYRTFGLCRSGEAEDAAFAAGRIGVRAYQGEKDILNLYFFNAAYRTAEGDYSAVKTEQIDWYRAESQTSKQNNGGESVPAVSFSHVSVPEVYKAFDSAKKGETGAFQGQGAGEGAYFKKDSDAILLGAVNEAPVTAKENNGLFDAFLDQRDVFASFSGSDHRNTYFTAVNGVDLVAMPSATYLGQNTRETRGVRLVRFYEDNVRDYELIFVPFSDYEELTMANVVPFYLATSTGVSSQTKVLILAGMIVLALVLLFAFDGKGKGQIPAPYDDGKEDIPLPEEKNEKNDRDET